MKVLYIYKFDQLILSSSEAFCKTRIFIYSHEFVIAEKSDIYLKVPNA